MSVRRVCLVFGVSVGSLGLVTTVPPVVAAGVPVVELDGGDVPAPIVVDGSQTFPIVPTPVFVPRGVEALVPVDETVTAELDESVGVEGLPLDVELVDEVVEEGVPGPTVPSSEPPALEDGVVVLEVESLPASEVAALGGEVLAFELDTASGEENVPVEVEILVDYSGMRYAFGADWAERVQLVRWDCPLEVAAATPEACGEPVPVEGVVDNSTLGVLSATVVVGEEQVSGGAGQSRLFFQSGSMLGLASSAGSFAATTLSNSGQWQVGGNTGAFSYSYPIAVPPALNGLGPSVSLSYSSAGADGVTSAVNSQPGEVGIGWSLSAGQGFIERRYLPCTDSRVGGGSSDTCWYVQNGTISLNGHSSELVPLTVGQAGGGGAGDPNDPNSWRVFRLKDDPDWIVTRHPAATGDWWSGEKWSVTTPDGFVYWFGENLEGQDSVLTIPIRGIHAGEPCYAKSDHLCDSFPYRWMLDRVVDPFGNEMVYRYTRERQRTKVLGDGYNLKLYDRAVLLKEIVYGRNVNDGDPVAGGVQPAVAQWHGRVEFTHVTRCGDALIDGQEGSCDEITNANGAQYPDVPTDLVCAESATFCDKGTSFFSTKRLVSITTYTNRQPNTASPVWEAAGQWRLFHAFPNPGDGGNEKLWLYVIHRVVPLASGGVATVPVEPTPVLPGSMFEGTPLRNRFDTGGGVPQMKQFRLSRITDDLGQVITAAYTTTTTCPTGSWSTNTTMCYPMYASLGGGTAAGWGIYKRHVVASVTIRDAVTGPDAAGQVASNLNTVTPDVVYTYTYAGAAHHHDGTEWWADTPGVDDVSWSEWRGFKTVTTSAGSGTNIKSISKQVFYQGMHGDKNSSGGTKTVTMAKGFTLPSDDPVTTSISDNDWLSGQVFESYQLNGTPSAAAGSYLSASRTYATWTATTAGAVVKTGFTAPTIRKWRTDYTVSALRNEPATVLSAPPGGFTYKYSRTDTSFDSHGRVTTVLNHGFLANSPTAPDETCSTTVYLANVVPSPTVVKWMNLPAQQVSRAGSCTGTVIGVSKTFYNGNSHMMQLTFPAPPAEPEFSTTEAASAVTQTVSATFMPLATASLVRTQNWDGSVDEIGRWLVTRTAYDGAGRPRKMFTPAESTLELIASASTEFGYDTTYGYASVATYRPDGDTVMTTSVEVDPETGQPKRTTDQNGRTTRFCYDDLGRTIAVYAPRMSGVAAPDNVCVSPGSLDVPDVTYGYSIGDYVANTPVGRSQKYPTIVVTSALLDFGQATDYAARTATNARRVDSAVYIDGNGRARETQSHSPENGALIVVGGAMTDERGNTYRAIDPFAIPDNMAGSPAKPQPGDRVSPPTNGSNGPPNGLNGFATWPTTPAVDYRITVSSFDTANRATNTTVKWKTAAGGSQDLLSTNTAYEGTRTISDPLIGETTATEVDGLGRAIRSEVYANGAAPTGQGLEVAGSLTTYTYSYGTPALGSPIATEMVNSTGWLTTTMKDDGGFETVTVTDLAGRTYRAADPNAGTSWFKYDNNGNVTKTQDAAGSVLTTTYDLSGRPTSRSGPAGLLATWEYDKDTIANGLGMLWRETSYQGPALDQQYKSTITGYTPRYQIASQVFTIPGTFGTDKAAGDWEYATVWTEAGKPLTASTPTAPIANAVAEDPTFDVVGYDYNAYGAAVRAGVPGAGWPAKTGMYVTGTEIDNLGRVTGRTLRSNNAAASTEQAFVRSYGYQAQTGALNLVQAEWSSGGGPLQDVTYNRDPAGNVTSIFDNVHNTKECFLYDTRNRLIRAHTTAATANEGAGSGTCLTTDNAAPLTEADRGVGAYDQTYVFDQINRLQLKTDNYSGTTTDLAYQTGGTTQPHAVSKVTVTAPSASPVVADYTYNSNGAMTGRAGDTLTWDAQQRLLNYNTTAETYTYWTSNQRVQRTSSGVRTLYLPGLDITLQGPNRTVTKQITIDGAVVATTKTGNTTGMWWNCADMQNSTTCQAPIGGGPLQTHHYLPYGEQRTIPGTSPITTTDRGFLNQPEDETGLTYLNNRYHDPQSGAFVSVDPLVGQTGHAYLYGNGNPTTLTDPNGLEVICPRMGKDDMTVWFGMCAPTIEDARTSKYLMSLYDDGGNSWGDLKTVASFLPVVGDVIDGYDCIIGHDALACASVVVPGSLSGAARIADGLHDADNAIDAVDAAADFSDAAHDVSIVDDSLLATELGDGPGRTFTHFTDEGGAVGISGTKPLAVGDSVGVDQLSFAKGENPFLASEPGRVFVTDLGPGATPRQLEGIGVFGARQQYAIEFSEADAFASGARVVGEVPSRGIYSIPGGCTINGACTVTRVR